MSCLTTSLRDSSYQMDVKAQNLRLSRLAVSTALNPLKTLSLNAHISGAGFQVGQFSNHGRIGIYYRI